jgi:hypothetical protein
MPCNESTYVPRCVVAEDVLIVEGSGLSAARTPLLEGL